MKKLGIVIAMAEEFQAIENKIKEIKVHEEKGLKFFEGKIGEKECVIVKSGVGKVNAARTTQILIDNFKIHSSKIIKINNFFILENKIDLSFIFYATIHFLVIYPLGLHNAYLTK